VAYRAPKTAWKIAPYPLRATPGSARKLIEWLQSQRRFGAIEMRVASVALLPNVRVCLGDLYADSCRVCGRRGEYGLASQRGPDGCTEAVQSGMVFCADHFPNVKLTDEPETAAHGGGGKPATHP
jgi:hypothetical protein